MKVKKVDIGKLLANKKVIIPLFITVAALLLGLFYLIFGNPFVKKGAWEELKSKAKSEASIYKGATGAPRLITGDFSGYENKKDAEKVAEAFIKSNAKLYQIQDFSEEFTLGEKTDLGSITNVRFDQKYKDVPVYGAYIIVSVTKDFKVESASSTYVPNISLGVKPVVSKEKAAENAGHKGADATLYVYAPATQDIKGESRLSWLVKGEKEDVFVDAVSGNIITANATVYMAINREAYDAAFTKTSTGTLVINEKGNVANLPAGQPKQTAQNAFASTGTAYNYFFSRLNRDSWDGKGAKMITISDYKDKPPSVYNNAFWSNSIQKVTVGDGWGSAPIDIMGHEWAHGVTSQTAGLVYSAQSGAMNESFSDIFGTFTQFYSGSKDWTIGEGLANGALRNMKNPIPFNDPDTITAPQYKPTAAPCNFNNDYCGVHSNSAILNKVTVLLVEGGQHKGKIITPIGVEKTERLFYQVLATKLGKNSVFTDMRSNSIELAKKGFTVPGTDIKYEFTKKEIASIINAFASVGVGAADDNHDGKPDDTDPWFQKEGGIAIVDMKASTNQFNTSACGEPNKLEVYVLMQEYGQAKFDYSYMNYKLGNGEWKSTGDSKTEKVKYPEAGELGTLDWYKYTVKDLTEEADTDLSYNVHVIAKNAPASLTSTPDFSGVKVKSCAMQKTINSLGKINPDSLKVPVQNIPTNIPSVNVDVPTAEKALNKRLDASLSGYVTATGVASTRDPLAGEPWSGTKALFTFDLSDIAYLRSVNVTSANINLSSAVLEGNPFALGSLNILACAYGSPDAGDYSGVRGCTQIASISSIPRGGLVDITNYVKSNYTSGKVQLRLEFASTNSGDRTTDKITFPKDSTSLEVKYSQ